MPTYTVVVFFVLPGCDFVDSEICSNMTQQVRVMNGGFLGEVIDQWLFGINIIKVILCSMAVPFCEAFSERIEYRITHMKNKTVNKRRSLSLIGSPASLLKKGDKNWKDSQMKVYKNRSFIDDIDFAKLS